MSLRSAFPAFALAVALAPFLPAATARAQTPEQKAAAEILFNDAKDLFQKKDYAAACPKFAESLRLDPGIGVTLFLADCYEKQRKLASAWATFREAEELAAKQGDPRRDVAKKHAAAIEPNLSTLTIGVAPNADVPGLVVTRNGMAVGKAQWSTAIPVDGGPHVIAATAPNRQKWETTIDVATERARMTVTVPVLEPAPVTSPSASAPPVAPPVPSTTPSSSSSPSSTPDAPPPSPALPPRKIAAIAVGGVGVVAAGVGAIFGLQASSKLNDSNANGQCVNGHCTTAGWPASKRRAQRGDDLDDRIRRRRGGAGRRRRLVVHRARTGRAARRRERVHDGQREWRLPARALVRHAVIPSPA